MDGTLHTTEATGTLPLRSRWLIPPLALRRPRDVDEAAAMLAEPDAIAMAGGVEVIAGLKFGGPPRTVVLLRGIAGLDGIEPCEGGVRIGALATHERVARDPLLRAAVPGFAEAWGSIANIRIRHQGTLAGCLLAGLPQYDAPPALAALNARLVCRVRGETIVAPWHAPRGLVLGIDMPAGVRFAHDRSLRPWLVVSAAARFEGGRVRTLRLALGGAHRCAVVADLADAAELDRAALGREAQRLAEAWARALPEPDHLPPGTPGATWRRRAAAVLATRLITRLADG
ncbi:FAD binding domain-containing protein [Elioraea thermophila]|uniref:FAD binding domain-containing protein n=1 Tax=Elioraea thermophila TaxID=2185104 RepID=UPI0018E58527|nr:FAD binding domain-containing protein [Elioraea thermophila]